MIRIILGRRELGKTTLARYMAQKRSPRIIIDPRAQWPIGPEVDPFVDVDRSEMIADLTAGKDIIVQPRRLQIAVNALADVAGEWIVNNDKTRSLSVVFDESGLYHVREWDYVMRTSPRDRTELIMTTHRPVDVETDVRALVDTWCLFRMTQQNDLDVIEDRCGVRVVEIVQSLDPFQFVAWDDGKAEYTIYRNPAVWFTPSDAPLVGEPDPGKPVKRRLWD